jgi:glycosyltransferase involved in cell wall biosynthesis
VAAGSGPLDQELERSASEHDLDIQLVGHQSETGMRDLYAEADGVCLPSMSDPNPLAVIEALWAGLPVLLSNRVGNHPECLEHTKNGFLFDPVNPQSVADAVAQWLSLSPGELCRLGDHSLDIARRRFDPRRVITDFLDAVLAPVTVPLQDPLELQVR